MGGLNTYYQGMKVSGLFVVAQLECMGPYKPFAQKILADSGIVTPTPGQWYDVAAFIKMFDDMSERFGSATVFQIGKKTVELAPVPPEVDSVEAGLIALCMNYDMHHQGTQIGFVRWTKTGDRSGIMVVHNPYPCDWARGAITGAGDRFKHPGEFLKVVHDDTKGCRSKGGDECTYHVSW